MLIVGTGAALFRQLLARWPLIIAIVLVLGLALATANSCSRARVAGVTARTAQNQTEAAQDSAADAVGAVGAAQAHSDATNQIHGENDHAIRTAPGADAPIDPVLAGAARRGLCRYAANRGKRECVQQPVAH